MKKQIAVILGSILLLTLGGLGVAQVGTSSMQGQKAAPSASTLEIRVVDPKGQTIPYETLPKDVQANLERVRKAAESLMVTPGGGGDAQRQRVKVTVSCSYPPLKCTITINF